VYRSPKELFALDNPSEVEGKPFLCPKRRPKLNLDLVYPFAIYKDKK